MLLRLDDVVCRYGAVEALHGVSLEVREGEFVALIGANGAGKSTLLRAISGLVPPAAGTISFAGQRTDGLRPAAIVKLGIAHSPEERKLWPDLSVADNLRLGAYVRRDRAAIDEDLRRVFEIFPVLEERQDQLAGTLSGGQQQMVAVGRALMLRPRLLMMDEPSLGLAPLVVDDVARVIKDIHRRGTTVLLVEQNAVMALEAADRAYILESGRIVREDDAKALLRDPYVKDAYLGGSTLRRRRAKQAARDRAAHDNGKSGETA